MDTKLGKRGSRGGEWKEARRESIRQRGHVGYGASDMRMCILSDDDVQLTGYVYEKQSRRAKKLTDIVFLYQV